MTVGGFDLIWMRAGALAAAHEGHELFVHDFYHLLGRGEALHHLMAHAALGNRFDEPFGDGVVYIRLQKGHTHFAHGVLYVLLGKLALTAQLLEHAAQLGSQRFKRHTMRPLPRGPKAVLRLPHTSPRESITRSISSAARATALFGL